MNSKHIRKDSGVNAAIEVMSCILASLVTRFKCIKIVNEDSRYFLLSFYFV